MKSNHFVSYTVCQSDFCTLFHCY